MKVIYNDYIPMFGDSMCIYPFVFVRNDCHDKYTPRVKNHEYIHAYQQVETLTLSVLTVLLFAAVGVLSPWWVLVSPLVYFALYATEWLIRWVGYGFNQKEAYKNISYEQEAYMNMNDFNYLDSRTPFSSLNYMFKKTYSSKYK